jgi:tRNA A37 threonylcarbamoyladenosine modification protein TsaB
MRTICIDLPSHDGHVACINGDAVRSIRVTGRTNETELIPLMEGVLEEAGWTKGDIEHIACNLGPGGFTSVRNGVAFANALADGLGVPLGGYHGSALALARSPADLWLHSTKAEALFVLGGSWSEPTLVSLADVLAATRPGMSVAGDLMDAHRTALVSAGASFPIKAPLEAVLPAFSAALAYGKEPLVPWYGRGI